MTSGRSRTSDSRWQGLVSQLLPAHGREPETVERGQAAVLVALVDRPGEPDLLLTRRAAHLQNHPSEVAFPGGKWESVDRNLVKTALRESFEETGLASDQVQVLGRLSNAQTLKNITVTPVVGVIPPNLPLAPDPSELDVIFTASLWAFRPEAASRWNEFERRGVYHRVPVFEVGGYTVWGLTAAMACQLAKMYYAPRPQD